MEHNFDHFALFQRFGEIKHWEGEYWNDSLIPENETVEYFFNQFQDILKRPGWKILVKISSSSCCPSRSRCPPPPPRPPSPSSTSLTPVHWGYGQGTIVYN